MKNNLCARAILFALLCTSAHAFSMNHADINTFCQQFFAQLDSIVLVNEQMTQEKFDPLKKKCAEKDLVTLRTSLTDSNPDQKKALFSPSVQTTIWESRLAKVDALLKSIPKKNDLKDILVTIKLNIIDVISNQTATAPTPPSKIDPAAPTKHFFTKKIAGAGLLIAAMSAGAYCYYINRVNAQDNRTIPAA